MQVYEFVKLRNVYYAGSHGMDISTPLGSSKYEDQKHQIKCVDEKVYIHLLSLCTIVVPMFGQNHITIKKDNDNYMMLVTI